MPYREDAAVYAMKTAGLDAVAHRPPAQTELDQLTKGDDPMLRSSDPGDSPVDIPRPTFRPPSFPNLNLTVHT